MNRKKTAECELCEAMCPEAVDGTLSVAERRVFERHVAECAWCAKELEEAQRGAAWLGMLKGHTPEPPAALLAKILAGTTGAEVAADARTPLMRDTTAQEWATRVSGKSAAPAWALSSMMRKITDAFRIESGRATFQPRLAMTAAMAFVSLALTLNLTGVRLKNLRASSFTPAAIRRTVANESASVSRSFENMRVVYQVESRVSELRGQGPLADRQMDQQTPFVGSQPSNQAPTDSGIVRKPNHKGL
ncbi:MAG TPA: zf-HC2 domain-containing protein [Acidobacteriaceae bacterium]|nr:zf-HC2 domain-containing protein [Acidobacteriaceae bacterium]